jgi:uncharacterized membrane protein (DUF485 family)
MISRPFTNQHLKTMPKFRSFVDRRRQLAEISSPMAAVMVLITIINGSFRSWLDVGTLSVWALKSRVQLHGGQDQTA